jgi:hypothetical protein
MDDFTQIKLTINRKTRLVSKEEIINKRVFFFKKTLNQHILDMYIKLLVARAKLRISNFLERGEIPLEDQDWGFTYITSGSVRIDLIYS